MKKPINVGMYIGMALIERDLKCLAWLKAGRPVSFGPKIHKASLFEKLLRLKERLLASKSSLRLPKISAVNKTPVIRSI